MARRAAKRDGNEPQIVEALRACGATVAQINEKDIPDLLIGTDRQCEIVKHLLFMINDIGADVKTAQLRCDCKDMEAARNILQEASDKVFSTLKVFCNHTCKQNILIEVKDGYGKLTSGQREWHLSWQGQCDVAKSVDEALQIIGAIE